MNNIYSLKSALEQIKKLKEENKKMREILEPIFKYYKSFLRCPDNENQVVCYNRADCCTDPECDIYKQLVEFFRDR